VVLLEHVLSLRTIGGRERESGANPRLGMANPRFGHHVKMYLCVSHMMSYWMQGPFRGSWRREEATMRHVNSPRNGCGLGSSNLAGQESARQRSTFRTR
jgi:hypothetical protein